jgi:hypothetical protein
MAEFQPVQKRGAKLSAPTTTYSSQLQQLVEMGFDSKLALKTLEVTRGDLETAMMKLLDESPAAPAPAPAAVAITESVKGVVKPVSDKSAERKSSRSARRAVPAVEVVNVTATIPTTVEEAVEIHRNMMATYKINKCKEIANKSHDRKNCMNWHSYSDRRRNPFEVAYSSYECPNVIGGAECPVGDSCGHSHSMLERMFHPELYKISTCGRSEGGRKCDRGIYCAFAHSPADLRVSPSKLDPALADKPPAKPATADIVIADDIKERLLSLIKDYGKEGVHSSELYKKYQIKYNEPLEISSDKYGAKYKMKEMLEAHPNISSEFTRGHQPVYVFVDGPSVVSTAPSVGLRADILKERLSQLIKNSGPNGLLGSELSKKYLDVFGEKLELIDESGERLKMKEMLQSVPGIVASVTTKSQPKYTFDSTIAAAIFDKPKPKSWSAIAAAADKPKSQLVATAITEVEKVEKAAEIVIDEPAPVVQVAKTPAGKSFADVVAAKKAAAARPPTPVVEQEAIVKPEALDEAQPTSIAVQVSSSVVDQLLASVASTAPSTTVQESNPPPAQQTTVLPSATSLGLSGESSSNVSKLVPNVSIGDIVESPVSLPPSVFPLSGDSTLSSSLLFGMDKTEDSVQSSNSQQSKLHELLYKASASMDMKRDHSIMPPGLTKQLKSTDNKVDDDLSRKYTQVQNQVSAQQEQINSLQKDLAARKSEFDNQAAQLKSVQQKLKEAEARSEDAVRIQLKSDDEHHQIVTQYQEELKRVNQERSVDYNSAFGFFNQMDLYLEQQKVDKNSIELYSKEKLVEFTKVLPAIQEVCVGWKQQWKFKIDMLNQRTFPDPYASVAGRAFPMQQYPGQPMYDQSYFGGQPFPVYGGSYGTSQQLCAFPGCHQPGAFQCPRCYRVWYCSQEHQQ